jgi:molybdopterin converting factor small subunit
VVKVTFTSSLRPAFGGADFIEIEVASIRELKNALLDKYPQIKTQFDQGVAVAINGEIYRDNRSVRIPEDAEVFLMPRIQGG